MKTSPTQRSMKMLRTNGYTCQIVEKRIPFKWITVDLFGCIDIVAIKPGEIIGVQTTTDSNASSHIHKYMNEPRLKLWLKAGGMFIMHTWGKHGARGKRKLWSCNTYVAFVGIGDQVVFEKI